MDESAEQAALVVSLVDEVKAMVPIPDDTLRCLFVRPHTRDEIFLSALQCPIYLFLSFANTAEVCLTSLPFISGYGDMTLTFIMVISMISSGHTQTKLVFVDFNICCTLELLLSFVKLW